MLEQLADFINDHRYNTHITRVQHAFVNKRPAIYIYIEVRNGSDLKVEARRFELIQEGDQEEG